MNLERYLKFMHEETKKIDVLGEDGRLRQLKSLRLYPVQLAVQAHSGSVGSKRILKLYDVWRNKKGIIRVQERVA